ncbi:MAG: DUF4917 family protein [Candidatus Omnitrophica bacterium]|jgi:hypothetical protein|nr:DUF4917 family protein [Candidatus Omnitrophota bacterium]
MNSTLLDFSEALKQAVNIGGKKQLFLGNGFSIACYPGFEYGTLYEQAKNSGLSKHLDELLKRYGNNFEDVLKYLDEGMFLAEHYYLKKSKKTNRDMAQDYKELKEALITTISDNHPDYPSRISKNKFESCIKFLRNFDAAFTVNYDLLLYWASLHIDESKGEEFPFSDGFGREDDAANPDCSFSYSSMSSKPYLFFLHGALHLYTKDGHVWKRVWNTTGIPIIKCVREAFSKKSYPLVVTEGKSLDKLKKIESSSYLSQAYRKFKNIQGHLFIFGHSLSEQDNHILNAIICSEKFKLTHLWIGIHGDSNSAHNKNIIAKASFLRMKREELIPKKLKSKGEGELNIGFFDSASAHIWD